MSQSKRVIALNLTPPSLSDNTADADRLCRALKAALGTEAFVHIDLELMRKLPALLRESEYQVRCAVLRDRKGYVLMDARSARSDRPFVGLAVDLGTTRVVLQLKDLESDAVLGDHAFTNPQTAIGPDVLTRLHHADTEAGLSELQSLIAAGLNREIAALCQAGALEPSDICLVSVAGNTSMTHLLLGLDPRGIIREPYIPAVNTPGLLRPGAFGLELAPSARALIFPSVGSYFGGDLIAGILYSGMDQAEETAILVDVGTNAEVILGNQNWLIACAGAAGPALEGGVTRMGMTAGPGVIDAVSVDPQTREFEIHTLDAQPARGICGSGLIDLAAGLFGAGMVDIRGKLVPSACGERYQEIKELSHLVIVPAEHAGTGEDLTLSQADLDSLTRSKAAMYTILETLTATVGMDPRELSTFYVAGTFGVFINPRSAITIGMLPDLPLDRYQPLGNSSLGGAAIALTEENVLGRIDAIRDRITYLELNVNQDFMNRFSAAKFYPHTDTSRFPSVRVPG